MINQQTKYYDKKMIFHVYTVNDMIYLNNKDIWIIRLNKKLDFKFYSSYKIIEAIEMQTY